MIKAHFNMVMEEVRVHLCGSMIVSKLMIS